MLNCYDIGFKNSSVFMMSLKAQLWISADLSDPVFLAVYCHCFVFVCLFFQLLVNSDTQK